MGLIVSVGKLWQWVSSRLTTVGLQLFLFLFGYGELFFSYISDNSDYSFNELHVIRGVYGDIRLPIQKYCGDKKEDCPICYEYFCHGENITMMSNCSHAFHTKCIEKWVHGCKDTCPYCRRSIF